MQPTARKVGGKGAEQRGKSRLCIADYDACLSNEIYQAYTLLLAVEGCKLPLQCVVTEQLVPLLAWLLACKTVICRDFLDSSQNYHTAKKASIGSQF